METKQERAKWFAAGRISVGKISQLDKEKMVFTDWYVGKLRGKIVTDPITGNWKHETKHEAFEAAQAFKLLCKKEAM